MVKGTSRVITFLSFLSFLWVLNHNLLSQSNHWIIQHPPLTGSELKDICFVNNHEGWIAGQNGVILHTTDRGLHWEFQSTPIEAPPRLFSISFADSLNGWAAGGVLGYSYIIRTTDGGVNWIEADIDNPEAYVFDIKFISREKGFILTAKRDNHLYMTENAGESWKVKTISNSLLTDIYFINDSTGVICGDMNYIAKTTDGGNTWNRSDVNDEGASFSGIKMVNENTGYASSFMGKVFKTSDGALSWQKVFEAVGGGFQLNALHTFNEDTVIVVASYSPSTTIKTTDGGGSWNFIDTHIDPQITRWYFLKDTLGYGVTWNGAIIRITEEGEKYEEITKGTGDHLYAIDFCNPDYGLAGEDNAKLLFTSNGGTTWNEKPSPIFNAITNVSMLSSESFSVAGMDSIAVTNNGGASWDFYKMDGFINKMGIIPRRDKIYLCTFQNRIWVKGFNAAEWTRIGEISNDKNITDVYFFSQEIVYACGSMGTVFKSLNGGVTWEQISAPAVNYCASIYFRNEKMGWLGGGEQEGNGTKPVFYKTEDGGITWNKQTNLVYLPDHSFPSDIPHESNGSIKEIKSLDGINLYALSDKYVFHSNDEGFSWSQQSMDMYGGTYLTSLCVVDKNNMWIAGNSSFIWKYNQGSSSCIKEDTNNENEIHCSTYPNPFNSIVNIIFNVPDIFEDKNYTLTIYNIIGEEVFTDRAHLKHGENRLRWIPHNTLASGIYFVRVQIPNKILSSKVIYLK